MKNKLNQLLELIFKSSGAHLYLIDCNNRKIIIFFSTKMIELSIVPLPNTYMRCGIFYVSIRDFDAIGDIYKFLGTDKGDDMLDVSFKIFKKLEKVLYYLFSREIETYENMAFAKINTKKKVLLIINGRGIQETIENAFLAYCSFNNIDLTVLYRYSQQWGVMLNYDGFFGSLKLRYPKFRFIYEEDFTDDYIDDLVDENTELFSLQYDYHGKHKRAHLIAGASSANQQDNLLHGEYINIFSCFWSRTIGYSDNIFLNKKDDTGVYHCFNPQNVHLLNSVRSISGFQPFILSGGMSWSRDFSVLKKFDGKFRGILISDEKHDVPGFYQAEQIRSYYGFLSVFSISSFFVHTPRPEYSNDDRHKMIATALCAGKPVIIPFNDGLIVKEILENGLGLTYKVGDSKDLEEKILFFLENKEQLDEYSKRCAKYSKENMDINKFINLIFSKSL